MRFGDTIAAIASAPGPSARGIVRVSGAGTAAALGAVVESAPAGRGAFVVRARIGDRTLPALLNRFTGAASYTGEESAEIVLPGNGALLERALDAMLDLPGVRRAEPGEFTARAYLNGRLTLDQAEGVAATIGALNDEQLVAARELLSGDAGSAYRAMAEELTTLLALVEAGIDFTDQEDVVAIGPRELGERLGALAAAIDGRIGPGRAGEAGAPLARVVLAGRPNAGKSTLFNALLGRSRAVVSPIAGTTRDALEETVDLSGVLPGAGPVTLVDLAGLDGSVSGGVAGKGQTRAREAIERADTVVHCDPSGRFEGVDAGSAPIIRVRTKADLPGPDGEEPDVRVCALDGWNLGALRRAIAEHACASRAGGTTTVVARHRRALAEARARIADAAAVAREDGERLRQPEAAAGLLRGALDAVGELCGRVSPDDVIGRIFATFCVGK